MVLIDILDRPHRRCQKVIAIARHNIFAIYLDIRAATTDIQPICTYIIIYFLSVWLYQHYLSISIYDENLKSERVLGSYILGLDQILGRDLRT